MPLLLETSALRCLVLSARAAGIDVDAALGPHGIKASSFEARAQATELPLPEVIAILSALVDAGEPGWALRGARALDPGAMGVLDHLCSAAPTARACLDDFARYFALVAYGAELVFEDDALVLSFDVPAELERVFVEATFALLWSRLRAYLGRPGARPERVDLRAPLDPLRRHEWAQTVGESVVVGGRPANRVVVPAALLGSPLKGGNTPLRAFLDGLAAEALPASTALETWAGRVSSQLGRGPADVTLAQAAAQLAVSERTLRRRLAEEHTSFSELRQRELRRRAEVMLSAGRYSHGEIAFALGFSETSAFNRAFRRWTGRSPGAWRRLGP